jgi:hypothetical protein
VTTPDAEEAEATVVPTVHVHVDSYTVTYGATQVAITREKGRNQWRLGDGGTADHWGPNRSAQMPANSSASTHSWASFSAAAAAAVAFLQVSIRFAYSTATSVMASSSSSSNSTFCGSSTHHDVRCDPSDRARLRP